MALGSAFGLIICKSAIDPMKGLGFPEIGLWDSSSMLLASSGSFFSKVLSILKVRPSLQQICNFYFMLNNKNTSNVITKRARFLLHGRVKALNIFKQNIVFVLFEIQYVSKTGNNDNHHLLNRIFGAIISSILFVNLS